MHILAKDQPDSDRWRDHNVLLKIVRQPGLPHAPAIRSGGRRLGFFGVSSSDVVGARKNTKAVTSRPTPLTTAVRRTTASRAKRRRSCESISWGGSPTRLGASST